MKQRSVCRILMMAAVAVALAIAPVQAADTVILMAGVVATEGVDRPSADMPDDHGREGGLGSVFARAREELEPVSEDLRVLGTYRA